MMKGDASRLGMGLTLGVLAALLLAPHGWADAPASSQPEEIAAAPDTTAPARRVVAYYFHTTQRCASCRKIEAWSSEALHQGLADALSDGRLVWSPVNIDEKENKHFVSDYGLYTKSLVLVEEKEGEAGRWVNLTKVWQLLQDKEEFLHYVQRETREFLEPES